MPALVLMVLAVGAARELLPAQALTGLRDDAIAAFLWVAHDVAPRALTPKIKNFVQPKSWFVDFSTMTMN